ncbi:MAG: DUF1549 domain-containing protein, partial [Pirellulaceae bacterium]|nr:DUF1549 domain-containing protein [Pirellulaceae bacterium]
MICRLSAFTFFMTLAASSGLRAAPPVDFQTEVLPILSEHCNLCHGVDANQRQGGLRLDQRQAALRGGDSGTPAIVPGKPDDSELVRRITSTDEDQVMPPPSHNKPLSANQIETLRRWLADGAAYQSHWAFVPPRKAPLPEAGATHPVDAWVLARLRERATPPSPEAPAWTLCRRLYLDLIGLPPSPEELKEFEQRGFEATVDALLASERFGEKWARQWMDVARYSDTNGYEKDLQREQWAWRD